MADEGTIELGDEPQHESQVPLEEKYRQQMRQIISQKIEPPISTLPGMIEKQINLSPDFQRRDRWTVEKQSRFIESIIMNVPIPPVFLGEDDYGNYVGEAINRASVSKTALRTIFPVVIQPSVL